MSNFDDINRPDKLLRVFLSLNTDALEKKSPALNGISYQEPSFCPVQLPSIFSTVVYQVALETWCGTAFGSHCIESQFERGKIKAILKAGTSYIDYVSPEELHQLKQFRRLLHCHIR